MGDRILSYQGRLIPVDSDRLQPHPAIHAKLADYRNRHNEIYEVVGHSSVPLRRVYNAESDLGNLFADIHRLEGKAQIGLYPSGGIRRDIDAGEVTVQELLDAWPFLDDVVTVKMTGKQLLGALEQGLSLERGIMQVSGITVRYDPDNPIGSRVLGVDIDGTPLRNTDTYTVATGRFIANGGDLYTQFQDREIVHVGRDFSEALTDFFRTRDVVSLPARGRLIAQ